MARIGPAVHLELERIEALELMGMVLAHPINAETASAGYAGAPGRTCAYLQVHGEGVVALHPVEGRESRGSRAARSPVRPVPGSLLGSIGQVVDSAVLP